MSRLAGLLLVAGLVAAPACSGESERAPAPAESVWLALGGETFTLELAAEPAVRQLGLSGRSAISRNAGMLFVFPRDQPLAMVMRDCPVPIDVAFLDSAGRVVALHEMRVEPPRASGESRAGYEARLPIYRSGRPARFAIEVAGGRLAELGIRPGDRVALDTETLIRRAR